MFNEITISSIGRLILYRDFVFLSILSVFIKKDKKRITFYKICLLKTFYAADESGCLDFWGPRFTQQKLNTYNTLPG
ncbi:hypothetical protein, partial [Citrobacter freundii]|uniref:hypothetical protein n=1 Tax=Citrobacter freundii TaxID=546 RepID=UPI00196B5A2C